MTQLTVASLNTLGVGSHLRTRYRTIGRVFETSDVDVVNLQEVLTYYHLQLLRRSMPSYRASFRPSAAGPAGGLTTFSRHPVTTTSYRRLTAVLKGALVTRLADVTIVNTHLSANRDGDWSPTSRYYVLLSGPITVESADLTFTDKLGETYATDHLGLQVRLHLATT